MKYQMRASAADPAVHEIQVYDFIGDWIDGMFGFGVTAKSFIDDLASMPESVKTIQVRVNSPGGDVFSAVAIANVLRDQRMTKGRKVEMYVDGLAASAASLLIMAGDTIQMADNGLIMVHDAWTVKQGNARDLRAEADRLDKLRDSAIVPTYQWHVKLSASAILDLMSKETWMDAQEALALGFATEVVSGQVAAAALDLSHPVSLVADERHAEALAALLAAPPPPKKKEPVPPAEPAPADPNAPPAEEPAAAPAPPAEEEPAAAPAEPDPNAPPAEEPAAPPAPPEEPAGQEAGPPKDVQEAMQEQVDALKALAESLADGSRAFDADSSAELLELVDLLQQAMDGMPAPAPAPEGDAPAKAALEVPLSQARASARVEEEPVLEAEVVPTVPAAEVLRRCVENKLSLSFAAPLATAALTEEELTLRIRTEVSRLEADATRRAAVRAMFEKHNLEEIGDLVAAAGVGVASAGRIVTAFKARMEAIEIDGSVTPTVGRGRKVLSYREAYDRVNSPFKKEK